MADNILEQRVEDGQAIREMTRTKGWQIYKERIEEEIKEENEAIRQFDIAGKSTSDIAAEYLEHRANLNAYENALGFVYEFLKAQISAQNKL